MEKKETYFVDIDGTIFKYRKFETYESTTAEVIESTKQYLIEKKNEFYNKIEDLASYYQIPKSRVLTVIISDAHTTIMKGNDNE